MNGYGKRKRVTFTYTAGERKSGKGQNKLLIGAGAQQQQQKAPEKQMGMPLGSRSPLALRTLLNSDTAHSMDLAERNQRRHNFRGGYIR